MKRDARFGAIRIRTESQETIAEDIIAHAQAGRGATVFLANAHMMVTAQENVVLRALLEKSLFVLADGMSLVLAARWLGEKVHHIRGTDLMRALCERSAAKRIPIALIGGTPDTLSVLCEAIQKRWPTLQIGYAVSPPFADTTEAYNDDVVRATRSSGAKLLFVGLGCPKQELWAGQQVDALGMPVVCVGAAFDFLAGTKEEAPTWVRRTGLEWLHRLMSEPRRLWKRYAVTNPKFIWLCWNSALPRRP